MKQWPAFRALLGLMALGLGFGGVWMTAACGSSEPSDEGSFGSGVDPPDPPAESPLEIKGTFPPGKRASLGSSPALPTEPIECRDIIKPEPCKRHRIPILGSTDVVLRAIYKAKFGSACYVSVVNTFDCFYKIEQVKPEGKACKDAQLIGELSGNEPYGNYPMTCKNVPGTEDWSLQIGPDVANKLTINYQDAPLETSLIDVNGVPTEINGPYRNLPEPSKVKIGGEFDCYRIDGVLQNKRILDVNRKANGDKIRSDLAGYVHPCTTGSSIMCTEPTFLEDPAKEKKDIVDPALLAQVHHEVRKTDLRGCAWGTNSNKNAAVISARLNQHLYNKYPTKKEADQINAVPPYIP